MKELNKEIERVKIVLENYLTQYDNTKQEEDKNIIEIVAEKVTFLSSRKESE